MRWLWLAAAAAGGAVAGLMVSQQIAINVEQQALRAALGGAGDRATVAYIARRLHVDVP